MHHSQKESAVSRQDVLTAVTDQEPGYRIISEIYLNDENESWQQTTEKQDNGDLRRPCFRKTVSRQYERARPDRRNLPVVRTILVFMNGHLGVTSRSNPWP